MSRKRKKSIPRTKEAVCPHCGEPVDSLDDDWLDTGYQILKGKYTGGSVQHGDENIFYVDLDGVRLVFEFGNNETWRIHEAWIEVPHMTISINGSRIWQADPEDAVMAVFNRGGSYYESRPERNP